MTVEYSRRALSDPIEISTCYAETGNQKTGERIALRIRDVVARIARFAQSGRPAPGVRTSASYRCGDPRI